MFKYSTCDLILLYLEVVPYTRHIGSQLLSIGEADYNALSVCTVWLFRLLDNGPEHHSLGKGDVVAKRVWTGDSLAHMGTWKTKSLMIKVVYSMKWKVKSKFTFSMPVHDLVAIVKTSIVTPTIQLFVQLWQFLLAPSKVIIMEKSQKG